MTITSVIEVLIGASALFVGALYIVGGLIVNLHLAKFGVTEYQILRVKYFVVGITYATSFVAVIVLACLPALLVLTLDFYAQQLFFIASIIASTALLWMWGKSVAPGRARFFFSWRFWVLAGAIASTYPIGAAARVLIAPGLGFETAALAVQGVLAGILAFVGQTYFYARHLYARQTSILGSVDPIGMGIPVEVRLALKQDVIPPWSNLGHR